jgi:uncharacterized protein (TIGR02147 family)
MIYEHENYREFLKTTLAEKCSKNSAYSLRAFATHMKISPSMLSEVIKGKKHLSTDMALKISEGLGLTAKEKDYFYNLVLFETAKNVDLKIILEKKINKMRPKKAISDLSLEMFRVISDPAHVTILEMASINNLKLDFQLAARAAGISEIEAQVIIDRLERIGLIEKNAQGFYQKAQDDLVVKSQAPNIALRSFHSKMLEKAVACLESQSNDEKFVGSETFAFSAENLVEAEEILEECFSRVLMLAKKSEKKDAIYHLGIQLFNLTKKGTLS